MKPKLDDYLKDEHCREVINILNKYFPDANPLEFFATVQNDYAFFMNNWTNYNAIVKHFAKTDGDQSYHDVVNHVLLQGLYDAEFDRNLKNPSFKDAFEIVLTSGCKAIPKFKVFANVYLSLVGFDFERSKRYGDSLGDLEERKSYWQNIRSTLQPFFAELEIIDQVDNFDRLCENEIIYINSLITKSKSPAEKSSILTTDIARKIDVVSKEEMQQVARQHLDYLNGFNKDGFRIMSDADFRRLIEMVNYVIEYETLPTNIKPLPRIEICTEAIIYTFYLIQKDLYGRKRRLFLIDLLHSAFLQFADRDKQTTYKRFSEKPKGYETFLRKC